jgi:glycine reductase
LDGAPLNDLEPVSFDPRRMLDGSLTNGAYDWAAVRNVTAAYQDPAVLRELFARQGTELEFAGLILALGYLDTPEQKLRSAEAAANVAKGLGADGVICTTFSSGNSHTDTMLTIRACEALGIATTGLVCETNGGLTDHVLEADCLVSTGNEDEPIPAWTPHRVNGNTTNARIGEPVPMWAYLGGCSQMGQSDWTAVPA